MADPKKKLEEMVAWAGATGPTWAYQPPPVPTDPKERPKWRDVRANTAKMHALMDILDERWNDPRRN